MSAERQVIESRNEPWELLDRFLIFFFGSVLQVAIHLMVNQLLGVSSESEVDEMSQLFSDFVDGCLSVPINLPGFTYHKAMKVMMFGFFALELVLSETFFCFLFRQERR